MSDELARLIAEQQRDMRFGHVEYGESNVGHIGKMELFLDQDGRYVREGNFSRDGRLGDVRPWKLKTASYTPLRGCRKYPKAHGQQYMIDQGGTRRCGRCNAEYEAGRRVRERPKGPQCGHPATEMKPREDTGYLRCMECNRIKAREWRERKRRNG